MRGLLRRPTPCLPLSVCASSLLLALLLSRANACERSLISLAVVVTDLLVLSRLVVLYVSRLHPLLCYSSSDCSLSEVSCCSPLLVRIISPTPSCPHPLPASRPRPSARALALFLPPLSSVICVLFVYPILSCIRGSCGLVFTYLDM